MLRNIGIFIACLLMAFFAGKYDERQEIKAEVERIESSMRDEAAATTAKLEKEKRDAQIKVDQLRADVAAGTVRLSVRASCSSGAAEGDQQARAELDTKTADDLISIAADGDQAIIELNSCIDFYNNLRGIK
jgi:prophage endopeptidase